MLEASGLFQGQGLGNARSGSSLGFWGREGLSLGARALEFSSTGPCVSHFPGRWGGNPGPGMSPLNSFEQGEGRIRLGRSRAGLGWLHSDERIAYASGSRCPWALGGS